MQYILTNEELNNLVPLERFKDAQKTNEELIQAFRHSLACRKQTRAFCDKCPISKLGCPDVTFKIELV